MLKEAILIKPLNAILKMSLLCDILQLISAFEHKSTVRICQVGTSVIRDNYSLMVKVLYMPTEKVCK